MIPRKPGPLLALLCAFFVSSIAAAAAPNPSMAFTVAVGNIPTIEWTCPVGTATATAAGGWSGTKAASGSEVATKITASTTYTITCAGAADTQAVLTWAAPTQNTDGSALTDLAGFRVYHGTGSSSLPDVVIKPGAGVTGHTFTGLAIGTHYFAVAAYNALGVESAMSAVVSKAIVAPFSVSASITIKVPNPPGAPTVQ